mmetsp:Transcript_36194/g.56642  ORF Transcript_36194/g.56642 Transcript_36194/m.56642 type:complete len:216 (+) Transcript_36194:2163-2810(+)
MSAPGLRMKISGVRLVESWKQASRSKGGDSMNSGERHRPTNRRMAKTSFSSRNARRTRSCWKGVRPVPQFPGSVAACGVSEATIASCHWAALSTTSLGSPRKASPMVSSIISRSPQVFSDIHLVDLGRGCLARRSALGTPGPMVKHRHSTAEICLACRRMFDPIMKAYSSLSFSNRPRQTFLYMLSVMSRSRISSRCPRSSFFSLRSSRWPKSAL